MEELGKKLTNLLEVKKLIALIVTIVFCVLAYKGTITEKSFVPIVTMVIGYYFGQSSARHAIRENTK